MFEPQHPTPPRTEVVRLGRARTQTSRFASLSFVLGAVLLAAGLIGFTVTMFVMRESGWAQLGAYAVALVIIYMGLSRVGKVIWGPRFDLTLWLALIWVVLIVLAALLAPILPLGEHENSAVTLLDPVMARPDLLSSHPLGTNNLGLDMLARVIFGARISLVVALTAVLIGMVVGGVLGILAGFYRSSSDRVIGIFTNSLLAVPPLILLIALATVMQPNIMNLAFALSLMALPSMIRISRANTLAFVQREFVLAGRSMGASDFRLMFRELLPNVLIPLASYGMLMVSILIVAEASLSFLGLGTPPPTPTWGNMIAEGEGRMFQLHPHVVLVPGAVLFLTVFSFNLLGEKARTHFDSRSAKV